MPAFTGFRLSDFRTSVRGTHWRHRRALGGALRQGLRAIFGRDYETWGAPGMNCLHIARRQAYTFPPRQPQAHLFILAQPSSLRWGLRIQGESHHWRQFRERLQRDPATLALLMYLLSLYPFTLTDLTSELGGVLGGCWRFERGELTWLEACTLPSPAIPEDVRFRIAAIPQGVAVDIALYTEVAAQKAVAWGEAAAERLLPTLTALVPLYELCVAV